MTAAGGQQRWRTQRWGIAAWLCGTVASGVAVLVTVLLAGGGAPEPAPPGLPSAGPLTGWALPISRVAADVSAVAAVGFLLAAGVLLPPQRPGHRLDPLAARAARRAAVTAVVWALAATAATGLTVSHVLGRPVTEIVQPSTLGGYATSLPQARALVVQALAAMTVAAFAGLVQSGRGPQALLCVAGAGLAAPLLTGHAAAADLYGLAVASLLVHVWAVAVWVGGLGVLVWVAFASPRSLTATVVTRYSRMASVCIALVAASGVLNGLTHLPRPAALVTGGYGQLVLAKAAALAVLAGFGWWHRRRTIPTLAHQGEWRGLARVAAMELVVMVATVSLAVGLSRTPLPTAGHTASMDSSTVAISSTDLRATGHGPSW